MSHERQQIRDAVVAQLKGTAPTYRTAAGARVFKTRMVPIRTAELPALNVYVDSETVDTKSSAPVELTRTVVVAVEGWVSASDDVDDALDDLGNLADPVVLGGRADVERLVVDEVSRRVEHREERPTYVLDVYERSPRRPVALDEDVTGRHRIADEIVDHEITSESR